MGLVQVYGQGRQGSMAWLPWMMCSHWCGQSHEKGLAEPTLPKSRFASAFQATRRLQGLHTRLSWAPRITLFPSHWDGPFPFIHLRWIRWDGREACAAKASSTVEGGEAAQGFCGGWGLFSAAFCSTGHTTLIGSTRGMSQDNRGHNPCRHASDSSLRGVWQRDGWSGAPFGVMRGLPSRMGASRTVIACGSFSCTGTTAARACVDGPDRPKDCWPWGGLIHEW